MYKDTSRFYTSKLFLTIASVIYVVIGLLFSNLLLSLGKELYRLTIEIINGSSLDSLHAFEVPLLTLFFFHGTTYFWYYIVVFVFILLSIVKIIYDLNRNFGDINKGQHGTSEFTTLKDLRKQYRRVPEKRERFRGDGGVVISWDKKKVLIDDTPVNNLIIGITRSGKGETFVFPTLDVYSRARRQPSLVFNDPKGELAAASYERYKELGYETGILNLVDPMRSMSYNPLQLIINEYENGNYSSAQLLANTLSYSLYSDPTAKDKFWQDSAMSLCNALILAITHDCLANSEKEKITMYSVANLLASLGGNEDDEGNNELDLFFQSRPIDDVARMQYATSNFSKGTTRGGIFASAMSKLQMFTFTEIAKMTSKNTIDLEAVGFGDKPIAIFMVVPDYDSSLHAIASIFVRQLYYVSAKKASFSKGGKCPRKIVFMLDEFGNMPPIEGMANIITVCLGRNIHFNLIIQSYSQLKKLYGEDSDTIVGNCGNQIYILTTDLNTAEHFSKLVGKQTIVDRSRSGKHLSFDKSESENTKERPLLTANELMQLMEGESVVFRVIKRRDNKRRKIRPKPIYNTGPTMLKARWQYLSDYFDTDKSILDVPIESLHQDVAVRSLLYIPEGEETSISLNEDFEEDEADKGGFNDLQQRIFQLHQSKGEDNTDV